MRIERKICDWNVMNIKMRHVKKSIMLLINSLLMIHWNLHVNSFIFPIRLLILSQTKLLNKLVVCACFLRTRLFDHFECIFKHFFRHQVDVAVIVHHELELIWTHYAKVAILASLLSKLPTRCIKAANLS
ncbi:hypothetical protein D3C81_1553950 [compost metagenome]